MGNAASITNTAGTITVSGLTNIVQASGGSPPVGGTLTIFGAATGANNGPFPVATWVSSTSVTITNASAVTDANNGTISWSLDWDTSAYVGTTEKNISSATDLATPDTSHGSYDISSSIPAFLNAIDNDQATIGNTLFSPGLPTPPGGGGGTTKYYKMVGFYVSGAVYESFVATGSPAASTCTNPNTTHTLINTYVASFYSR
jgi:hypothetical protein